MFSVPQEERKGEDRSHPDFRGHRHGHLLDQGHGRQRQGCLGSAQPARPRPTSHASGRRPALTLNRGVTYKIQAVKKSSGPSTRPSVPALSPRCSSVRAARRVTKARWSQAAGFVLSRRRPARATGRGLAQVGQRRLEQMLVGRELQSELLVCLRLSTLTTARPVPSTKLIWRLTSGTAGRQCATPVA